MERIRWFCFSKSRFFFSLKEPPLQQMLLWGCSCRTVLSFVIFGIRIPVNLTDGVFSVGLHEWCPQSEELLLSLKFGFMWTSNPHCSSRDSNAQISLGSSHHAQALLFPVHPLGIMNPTNPWLRWAGIALKLIEKLRTNNSVHLLMTHRHEGEIVCSELGLNPSRHQPPGLILR